VHKARCERRDAKSFIRTEQSRTVGPLGLSNAELSGSRTIFSLLADSSSAVSPLLY
jgi:hypothetical protein